MAPYTRPYTQQPQYASTPEAQELSRATLAGDFVDQENPYMQQVIERANRDTTAAHQGQLANLSAASLRPGQVGSSVWANQRQGLQDSMSQRIADSTAQMQFQGHEAERNRQNEVLGIQSQRDQGIFGDLTTRRGQDMQKDVAMSNAASSGRAAALNQRMQQQQTRANLLLGQGQLAENARQFDATNPQRWAEILGGQIGNYGQMNQGDTALLGNLMGQQMGAQAGAAQQGANLGLGMQGQQLQGAGMLPQYQQAGMAPMGMAGDYLGGLYNTQAGLQGARAQANASRYATNAQRDQANYASALNQWQYNNPQAALDAYSNTAGQYSNMAGGQSWGSGIGAPASGGTYQPGPSSGQQAAQIGSQLLMAYMMSGGV